jgi:succinyl-diaminopimelate desuccinylase
MAAKPEGTGLLLVCRAPDGTGAELGQWGGPLRQLGVTQRSRVRHPAVASLDSNACASTRKELSEVVTQNAEQLSFRLRERLSEPAMLDLTKRLIAIPSENPPGNHYEECARILFDELHRLGFDDVRREGACVLASAGTGPRTLCFSGHYDVVPAQCRDQFQPRIEGANLFGRGSSDMKSGLAAMIHAAAAARDEGLLKTGRIGIVLVPDEETAGPRGSRDLDARGLLGRDGVGMVTPEPTGGVIWNANRGAISLRATMRGKPAHVGRQFEGVNAFERAVPAMARLLDIKKEVELRETQHNIAPAAARKSILMLGGRAEAGTNFNVTPDFCSFTIDRRINPEENLEEEKRRLRDTLEGFEIETLQEEPAAATPARDPLGVILSRHIASLTGKEPAFEMCPGLLETRFHAAYGIPAFAYGPGLLTVSHGPNEFVPIRNIAQCAAIYALTAAEMLR